MIIIDEYMFKNKRTTKLIETDSLPIDIFRATHSQAMNAKIVIDNKTYDGCITIEHYIPNNRRISGLPYLSAVLIYAEKEDVLIGKTIKEIVSETGWIYRKEEE